MYSCRREDISTNYKPYFRNMRMNNNTLSLTETGSDVTEFSAEQKEAYVW